MSDNQILIKSKTLSNMSAVMAFISRTTKLKDISQFLSCNFSSKMWWGGGWVMGSGGGGEVISCSLPTYKVIPYTLLF